ncbi:MAG TPA: DegT/DnrJ/EryC1/StrS family aminotransferase [Thermomicrobiaceae bacterium]|nr:DegT/DnrJ/EryC1/StrS family aminotransferase [Thermomicrobiaceae bacterium]
MADAIDHLSQIPLVDPRAQYAPLKDQILEGIAGTLDSMHLLLGPNVAAFETEFARYCGARFAIGVANGTDALCMALRACGVRPGDEVITVSHSFIATAEAIVILGAIPVYVDVDPATYTLAPAALEAAIGPKTRAIIPVHLYGQMADMDSIMAVAEQYGLVVIEDACQAHGATYQGRRSGSIGDAAAFSFSVDKNLGAYGDAGAITTNSRAVAENLRMLRDHGSRSAYDHELMGLNSRLDELQAFVLRVKLPYLDEWNAARRRHAQTYGELLADSSLILPAQADYGQPVYHRYVVQTEERERARELLTAHGIATGIHYPAPIHQQEAARGLGRVAGDLRVTEWLARRVLSLPMYAELQPEQLERVAANLRRATVTNEFHAAN